MARSSTLATEPSDFPVADGSAFVLFASDFGQAFTTGNTFSLISTFADGSVVTVTTTIP